MLTRNKLKRKAEFTSENEKKYIQKEPIFKKQRLTQHYQKYITNDIFVMIAEFLEAQEITLIKRLSTATRYLQINCLTYCIYSDRSNYKKIEEIEKYSGLFNIFNKKCAKQLKIIVHNSDLFEKILQNTEQLLNIKNAVFCIDAPLKLSNDFYKVSLYRGRNNLKKILSGVNNMKNLEQITLIMSYCPANIFNNLTNLHNLKTLHLHRDLWNNGFFMLEYKIIDNLNRYTKIKTLFLSSYKMDYRYYEIQRTSIRSENDHKKFVQSISNLQIESLCIIGLHIIFSDDDILKILKMKNLRRISCWINNDKGSNFSKFKEKFKIGTVIQSPFPHYHDCYLIDFAIEKDDLERYDFYNRNHINESKFIEVLIEDKSERKIVLK